MTNLEQLPHGLGCKWLEVIESHIPGTYIAKRWHRVSPASDDLEGIFVYF
uniref:Uncharacterized protein n=1 Tax=viral metagenome TaxID=1070528 RepID=A0A6M3LUH5_9ZZZZ